ncbi:MAG TPA: hypothetical protein P5535_06585, partial [Clostridia bacterium]|nr:hypothetical protein [Clostridia bacterium]
IINSVQVVANCTVLGVTSQPASSVADGSILYCSKRQINKVSMTDLQGSSSGVVLSVNGSNKTENLDYIVDYNTGFVAFLAGHIPSSGSIIKAESLCYEKRK